MSGLAANDPRLFGTMRTVQTTLTNVCFEGQNGHDADVARCLLMTQSGHVRARWGIVTFNRTMTTRWVNSGFRYLLKQADEGL